MRLPAFLLLLALGGCATLPRALEPVTSNDAGPFAEIQVVSHGKHTGLIVEAASLNRLLPELAQRFGQVRHYEIGWGDAGFYRAEQITTGLTVNAVLRPTPTVVHVVALDEDPAVAFPLSEVRRLRVAEPNHEVMLRFICSSFEPGADGRPVSDGPGLYGDSEFYRGVGRYHLCNTCNKWTAKALYSAGVDIEASSTISSPDVMKQIRPRP